MAVTWPIHEMLALARMKSSALRTSLSAANTGSAAGCAPPATRAVIASRKRPRIAATGSSTVVMPATEIGPGMMRTESAG